MTHHNNFPLSSWFDCDVVVDIVVSLIAHHNLGDNCRSYTLNKHINVSDNFICWADLFLDEGKSSIQMQFVL